MKVLSLMLSLILVFSVFSITTLAEEDFTGFAVFEGEIVNAGITPDTKLYGLDLAIERIKLALTFNRATKAKVELKNAEERLVEAKLMIEEGKLEAAERARVNHDKSLKRVKLEIEQIDNGNIEQEIEQELELETKIENHENAVNELQRTVLKLEVKGNLNEEQIVALTNLIASFQGSTGELKIKIKSEQDKTITKIAAKRGKTTDDIKEEFRAKFEERMNAKFAENKEEYSKKAIERAETCIVELEELVGQEEEDDEINDEEEEDETEDNEGELVLNVETEGEISEEMLGIIEQLKPLVNALNSEVSLELEVDENGEVETEMEGEVTQEITDLWNQLVALAEGSQNIEIEIELEGENEDDEDETEDENSVLVLFELSKKKLDNAKSSFDAGNFGRAFGQANAAYHLCVNALRKLNGEEVPEEEVQALVNKAEIEGVVNAIPVDVKIRERQEVSTGVRA